MTRAEQIAAVLAEHYATGGYAAHYATLGQHVRGQWGCSCGASGPVGQGQRVVMHHRAHVAAALDAALAAQEGERGGAEVGWPCANYTKPATCLTAPSSMSGRCGNCAALAKHDAEVLRAAADALHETLTFAARKLDREDEYRPAVPDWLRERADRIAGGQP